MNGAAGEFYAVHIVLLSESRGAEVDGIVVEGQEVRAVPVAGAIARAGVSWQDHPADRGVGGPAIAEDRFARNPRPAAVVDRVERALLLQVGHDEGLPGAPAASLIPTAGSDPFTS